MASTTHGTTHSTLLIGDMLDVTTLILGIIITTITMVIILITTMVIIITQNQIGAIMWLVAMKMSVAM